LSRDSRSNVEASNELEDRTKSPKVKKRLINVDPLDLQPTSVRIRMYVRFNKYNVSTLKLG